MRCARRIGMSERVKFAEARRASVERGGGPCLESMRQDVVSSWRYTLLLDPTSQDLLKSTDGVVVRPGERHDHCRCWWMLEGVTTADWHWIGWRQL